MTQQTPLLDAKPTKCPNINHVDLVHRPLIIHGSALTAECGLLLIYVLASHHGQLHPFIGADLPSGCRSEYPNQTKRDRLRSHCAFDISTSVTPQHDGGSPSRGKNTTTKGLHIGGTICRRRPKTPTRSRFWRTTQMLRPSQYITRER